MFCHKCGAKVAENAGFCHKCGEKVLSKEKAKATEDCASKPAVKLSETTRDPDKVFCPKCRSHDLYPTDETETSVRGGGYGIGKGFCGWILLGPFGLLCGLCGSKVKSDSKTRHFWMCKSCGHKFRNAEDEKAEMDAETQKFALSGLTVFAVLYVAGNLFSDNEIRFLGISAVVYIVIGIIGLILFGIGTVGLFLGDSLSDLGKGQTENKIMIKKLSLNGLIASAVSFVAGIAFAVNDIRFFWMPAWVYIIIGILGALVCGLAKFLLFADSASDEELERLDAKYKDKFDSFVKFIGKFKRK